MDIKDLIPWRKSFRRIKKLPLDASSIFNTFEDALEYAHGTGLDERKLGKTSYLGQILSVVDSGNTVTVYKIVWDNVAEEPTLEEIGKGGGGTVADIRSTDNDILITTNSGVVYLTLKGISNPEFTL